MWTAVVYTGPAERAVESYVQEAILPGSFQAWKCKAFKVCDMSGSIIIQDLPHLLVSTQGLHCVLLSV